MRLEHKKRARRKGKRERERKHKREKWCSSISVRRENIKKISIAASPKISLIIIL